MAAWMILDLPEYLVRAYDMDRACTVVFASTRQPYVAIHVTCMSLILILVTFVVTFSFL